MSDTASFELTKFGMHFGTAFQIIDDTLDLVGQDEELGKDSGTDIRNGKQTLPLITAYEHATPSEREQLVHLWQNGKDLGPMVQIIRRHNGIEHSLDLARDYAERAKAHLTPLSAGKATDLLAQLADYVTERTR
jgi:octaprenyl-diphosphate synthase